MTNEMTIKEILSRGGFTNADIMSFWYDWFCDDRLLLKKGRNLLKRLMDIAPSAAFDTNSTYVFFKNNCGERLYDDLRICDKATGRVLFCVIPSYGRKAEAIVMGNRADGVWDELVRGKWQDVKTFFCRGVV